MSYLNFPAPPNLPLAPNGYERNYQDQFANVLRLYFNRLNGNLQSAFGVDGGQYINFPYGSFYDTTDQTVASTTTAYAVTLNTVALDNGVTVQNNSQIAVSYSGLYNIQYSIQLSNNDNATQDIDIWFRKNGTDIADSNSRFGLAPRKSAGDPYHVIAALNFFQTLNAGDYVELYWRSSNTNTYIEYYAAPSSPTRPAIPSVIVTVTFVSAVE